MPDKRIAILNIGKVLASIPLAAFAAWGSASGMPWLAALSAVPLAALLASDSIGSHVKKLTPGKSELAKLELPAPDWWTGNSQSWQKVCKEIVDQLPHIVKSMPEHLRKEQRVKTMEVVEQNFIDALTDRQFALLPDPVERRRVAEVVASPILQKLGEVLNPVIEHIKQDEGFVDGHKTATNTGEAVTILKDIRDAGKPHALDERELADLRQHYCHTLYEQWKMLDFKGILYVKQNESLSILLTEVFVFPDVLVGVPEYETIERADERESDERKGKKSARAGEDEQEQFGSRERRPRKEIRTKPQREEVGVVLVKSRRLVMLGDPGAGKSTLLKYLMVRLAQGKDQFIADFPQLADVSSAVPLYIRLAEYAQAWSTTPLGERSLKDFLPRYLRENYLETCITFLQTQLERGAVFLLLDGLDEIPDVALRMQIVRQVEAFTQFYPKNRFIVTSRIVGYKEAQLAADYQAYTLGDFNEKQISIFTQKWCPAYERWVKRAADNQHLQDIASKEAERLFQETQKNPGVKKLAVNPLLLTILAIIQRQGTKLPGHRIRLYELCATTLLDNWIEAKGISIRFNQNDLIKILRPLAFWMHEHKAVGAIPEEELSEQIVKQLLERRVTRDEGEAARLAAQFLETVRGQTGILVERGKQRYGFLHQTFEEYFAARELVKRKEQERNEFIRAHLHDARWREVVLLTVGIIGILDSNEEEVTELVNDVILEAGSPFEKWLHRDLLLAGLCLADDVGMNAACEDDIIERIVYLHLTSPYDALREAFSSVLQAWDGTPAGSKAARLVLTLFHHPEMLTDPQLASVRLSSSAEARFAQKVIAHYQGLVQLYQQSQVKLLRMQVLLILHTLQVETPTVPIEYALGLFSDSSWQVRQTAASALGQLGSSDSRVLDSLLSALSGSSWQVRQAAASALGQLGSSDSRVLDSLLSALSDSDYDVRQAAASA
ncbi:MAG: HEAT repeat domain-containing protein, partial [Ktedonobacteraceae bacterium]|nr:HEAT repeat domain-containing protein [Ktedonobacteraceae bacterium]